MYGRLSKRVPLTGYACGVLPSGVSIREASTRASIPVNRITEDSSEANPGH